MILDYHGMKPSGLQRTWPNVLNFEGVKGMENVKWATDNVPPYDVTLPFMRMMTGPMDYTPVPCAMQQRQIFTLRIQCR